MMRGTWDDLNRRLTSAILALDLDDSLVIGETQPKPRRTFFGGKVPQPARRYVQVTAGRDRIVAECVGSTSFGGEWPMSAEVEATLERQGWERPWSPDYRTWQREGPLLRGNVTALACVRALQLLGCEMENLDVELVREEQ